MEDEIELDISSSELDLLDPIEEAETPAQASNEKFEASAVCVTEGHMFIGSHADFLKQILSKQEPQDRLNSAADFHEVENSLSRLLPGSSSLKSFVSHG